MLSNRSASTVLEPPRRHRLAPPWRTLALAAGVGVMLVVLYPRQALVDQVLLSGEDALSVVYLRNLLRTEPDNVDLRMLLARRQMLAGQFRSADFTLRGVDRHASDPQHVSLRRLRYEIAEQRYFATPERDRDALLEPMRVALATAVGDARSREDWAWLAARAQSCGAGEVARRAYVELARHGEADRWLEQAARAELALGHHTAAAELFLAAQDAASSLERARSLFFDALHTYQAGDRADLALRAAHDRLDRVGADREMLLYLARLALAAGNLGEAEAYARRLLRLGWLVQHTRLATLDANPTTAWRWLPAAHAAAPRAAEPDERKTIAPFDAETYQLAFDIFLANRNLKDALAVAEAAVRQRPEDETWRRRLAQVAEWNGQPALALTHWRELAHRLGSREAWDAVARLAPALFDEDAVAEVLERKGRRESLGHEELERLAYAWDGIGDLDRGIAYLSELDRKVPRVRHLELIADFQLRSNRNDAALTTLTLLAARHGDSIERAMRRAALLIGQGRMGDALDALGPVSARADAKQRDFWTLYGELAWQQRRDRDAERAYRMLGGARPEGLALDRLVALLRGHAPLEAAALSESAWRAGAGVARALDALRLRVGADDWRGAHALLDALDAAGTGELESRDEYWRLRADVHQRHGETRAAYRAWLRALALRPDDESVRAALLWFLIDRRDTRELDARARAWTPGARGAELREALAAAWTTLEKPREAYPLQRALADRHRDDPLWLVHYAQTLEAVGRADQARRVIRAAWERARAAQRKSPGKREPIEALARINLRLNPGDPARVALARLAALPMDEARVKERNALVLLWLLGRGHDARARAWLASRAVADTIADDTAEYARFVLALAEHDMTVLVPGLDRPQVIPVEDRVIAARAAGEPFRARHMAFDAVEKDGTQDNAQELMAELMTESARRGLLGFEHGLRGDVRTREWRATGRWPGFVEPKLELNLAYRGAKLKSDDILSLARTPAHDRELGASLTYRRGAHVGEVEITRRDALDANTGLKVAWSVQRGDATVAARLGVRRRADEGAHLRIAGMKNEWALSYTHPVTLRDTLELGLDAARYATQDGHDLGSGRHFGAAWVHKLLINYPDWGLRGSVDVNRYSPTGALSGASLALVPAGVAADAGFFLPADFTQYGLGLIWGDELRLQYFPRWRSHGEIALSHNSESGLGKSASFGLIGGVFGRDRLRLLATWSEGGGGFAQEDLVLDMSYEAYY